MYQRAKRYFLKKDNRFKLASLIVLLLTLPAALILVQQTFRFFSGANEPEATVYILPTNADVTSATTFQVMIDPKGNPVATAEVSITFDHTKIQLTQDPTIGTVLGNNIISTTANQANTTGVVSITSVLDVGQASNPPTQPFELAQLQFEPVVDVGNDVSVAIGLANVIIGNKDTAGELLTETVGSTIVLNPTAPESDSGTVDINVADVPVTIYEEDTFNFTVRINTNGFPVVGTDLVMNFDPSNITLIDATHGLFDKVVNEAIDNQNGTYQVSLLMDTGTLPLNGSGPILSFTADAAAAGQSQITISSETVIAGTGEAGQNLTLSTVPQTITILAATPTPTPQMSASCNELFTRIQNSMTTVCGDSNFDHIADINKDGIVNITDFSLFSANINGAWCTTALANNVNACSTPTPTATASPTPSPVSGTATPTATAAPTATPVPTQTSYRPEDINEDGTVGILDYVILFEYYGTTVNHRADINRDGRVNVKDYALLYQAFE